MSANKSYVYIIRAGEKKSGPVKIGVSDDAYARLKTLQTGNHQRLHLIAHFECKDRDHAFSLEKTIHEILKDQRLFGEWFSVKKTIAMKCFNLALSNAGVDSCYKAIEGLVEKSNGGRKSKECKLKATIASRDAEIEDLKLAIARGKLRRGAYYEELFVLGLSHSQIKSLHAG